jgi:hypothetical protein
MAMSSGLTFSRCGLLMKMSAAFGWKQAWSDSPGEIRRVATAAAKQ